MKKIKQLQKKNSMGTRSHVIKQLIKDLKKIRQKAKATPRAAPGGSAAAMAPGGSAAAMAAPNADPVALLQQVTNYGINTSGLTNIEIKRLILSMQNINITGMTNKDINNKFSEITKIHNIVRKNTKKWSCKKCTYNNPSNSNACKMCGAKKI